MPFQSVPDCAEIVIQGTYSGKQIANVLGAYKSGGYSQADLDNLASNIDTCVDVFGKPLFHTAVQYTGVLVRGLTSSIDLQSTNTDNAGPGAATGDATPPNVSFCVTLRTAFTGRSARGRFFMWPMGTDNLLDQNTVASGYATDAVAYVTQLRDAIAVAGWQHSIISRFQLGSLLEFGIPYEVTTPVARNNLLDSQRNRMVQGH